jgi:DNA-binding CsgD family transcriptional regulator
MDEIVALSERFQRCATAQEVGVELSKAVEPHGFNASACGAFVPTKNGPQNLFYFRNWPQAWLEKYDHLNAANHDFGVAEARKRSIFFAWTDVKPQRQLSLSERKLWDAFLEFGWRNGLSFPFHGPGGYFGLLTMASSHEEFSPRARLAMSAVAQLAHHRCREMNAEHEPLTLSARFSARELECLRWVASGKSDVEIARTIDLSVATVKDYVDGLRRKIGAKNRAQAVAMLMSAGLI